MSLLPNEELLNYKFDTYRINLKQLSRRDQEINCELFDWTFKTSIPHHSKVKAYGFHNNLVIDDYNLNHVYFVSRNGKIFKTMFCENNEKLSEPIIIFEKDVLKSEFEHLPPNLFFLSSELACYVNGYGEFYLLNTFDRNPNGSGDTKKYWELLYSMPIVENNTNSTLLECRLERLDNSTPSQNSLIGVILHCCIMRISTSNLTVNSKNVELVWISYQYCEESKQLAVCGKKLWKGDSPPEMVTFSNDFKTLQIISNHSFRYIDTDINCDNLSRENVGLIAHWCNESSQSIQFEYFLNIPQDKFTLEFQYPNEENNEIVISLHLQDKSPLELYRKVSSCLFDESKTHWKMENELLLITFRKITFEEVEEEVASKKPKIIICGNEDVDDLDDTELGIGVINRADGSLIDEEISISKNEWLFMQRLRKNEPFSVCLRSNIDGLLWTKLNSGDNWTHCHTLNAFGYVAAAKVDRKFMCCSLPDKEKNGIKFAVITDWKRELYILMQYRPLDSSMTVKNRCTGQIVDNVADEFLVTLEKSKEIMGIVANTDRIFVLYRQSESVTGISVINCV